MVVNIHLNDDAVENDSDGKLINNMIRSLVLVLGQPRPLPDLGVRLGEWRERREGDQLTARDTALWETLGN